jgi:type IV pilus assembly protein PilQ
VPGASSSPASTQVGVDIRQQGQNLVVEFLRSTLPDACAGASTSPTSARRCSAVSTFQSGDRVRMVVEPVGSWEHSAYQTDNQFVLEVRPMKVDPNKLTQGPGFSGEKLSLNFQNIEVRALLQVIADFTNFNVVTSDTVTGTVTLRLKDVPWDQALDIIMQSKGLGVRKSATCCGSRPRKNWPPRSSSTWSRARRSPNSSRCARSRSSSTTPRPRPCQAALIGSAQVAQAVRRHRGQQPHAVAARQRDLRVRTNQLFVTDIPSKLEEVQAVIAKIDIPVRQVLIEARIVEADDTFGRAWASSSALPTCAGARRHPGLRRRTRRRQLLPRPPGAQTCRARRWTSTTRSSSTCRPTPAAWASRPPPSRCRCSASRRTTAS